MGCAIQLVQAGISINDVSEFEGSGAATAFVFTITLAGATAVPVTVGFETANGAALAGGDYVAQSGTVTFTPGGPNQQTITIQVVGDEQVESDRDLSGRA